MTKRLSPAGFDEGTMLTRDISGLYKTVQEAVCEAVQNAIDANARVVHLSVNRRRRIIIIRDNGDGSTIARMEKAFSRIGRSLKDPGRKLGRFGLGSMAFLDKASLVKITTCPKSGENEYTEWTFVSEDLRTQDKLRGFPLTPRRDLAYTTGAPDQRRGLVNWRTEIYAEGVTTERLIGDMSPESLDQAICSKYGLRMREQQVVVRLKFVHEDGREEDRDIRAKDYDGKPFDEVVLHHLKGGDTVFRIFLAKRGKARERKGVIHVSESGNPHRIPISDWLDQARRHLPEEVVRVFKSGVFEGDITNNTIRMLNTRTAFREGDAFDGFITTISEWWGKYGSKHFRAVQEDQREVLHQESGLVALEMIQQMLRNPEFQEYRRVIREFTRGTVGAGHAKVSPRQIIAQQEQPSLKIGVRPGTTGTASGLDRDRHEPSEPKPGHIPLSVTGPLGRPRTVVRKTGFGLQFAYDEAPGGDPFTLDPEQGVITFNTVHKEWRKCGTNQPALAHLQTLLTIQALTLLHLPAHWVEATKLGFNQLTPMCVFCYLLEGGGAKLSRSRSKTGVKATTKRTA